MFLRSQFNYDTDAASLESGLACQDKSLAQQHQAEEADINTIVKRFGITGMVPQGIVRPHIDDFVDVMDYRTALHAVMEAQKSFMAMPADVRSRFGNDPAAFVDFCSDEGNLDELRKMGLAVASTPSGAGSPAPSGEAGSGG